MEKRAQATLEYLIILGFVSGLIVPMVMVFTTHSTEINENIIINQADNIASKIVDSAESVYYLGEASKSSFTVKMPKNIDSISIGNNEVVFFVRKSNGLDEIVKYCTVPINGTIATSQGIHQIVVESKGDYVWVSS